MLLESFEIDDDRKMVTVDGEPVKVTPYEYNILSLIKNPGTSLYN